MSDLAPLARFDGLIASGLQDVTDDPAALDSSGFWAVCADFEGRTVCARFSDVRKEAVPPPVPGAWRGPATGDWDSSLDRDAYTAGVRRIREHIAAGDVYQANLCRVLSAPLPDGGAGADVDALTSLLARGNPAPYAGTIRLPGHGVEVATASPELFLRRDGRIVESGPIKGTGRTENDLLAKDHAENVMIVDLVRNDLGRVCATGSVSVPDLCVVEKHPGLVHLVSSVRGRPGRRGGLARAVRGGLPARLGHRGAEVQRAADHRRAGAGPARAVLRCGRLGRRRPWHRLPRGGHKDVLDRPDRARAAAAVRYRGRDHLGLRPGARMGRDRTQGLPTARCSVGCASGDRKDRDMRIWVNGGLRDADDARLSVLDHGLTVGDGIFETVRTSEGRPFALTRHLDRLTRSARGLGLPDPDHDEVRRAAAAVIDANPVALGRLRITCTGGLSPLGSDRGTDGPSLVVALDGVNRRPDSTAVITVPWTRNERGALTGLKTTSYAENVVALARARERGASEALFANTADRLCEGTGSNVFVVLDGRIHTPPVASGCLAGITRALAVEWTGAEETDLPMDVLAEADEVFLTSTLRDVQAVHRLDDRELTPEIGPVTAKAMRIFAERSGDDLDP